MNEAQRAYNLMRAFVNREWDRVKGLEFAEALRELDAPAGESVGQATVAENREKPLDDPTKVDESEYEATARTILGVHADADFAAIRLAFVKINRRARPENFESGTTEAVSAENLLRRATWAYNYLTKNVSASEKRFKSLEID